MSRAGGNPTTLATLTAAPLGIAVDANNAYVCNQARSGQVVSVPKGDDDGVVDIVHSGGVEPLGIAVDQQAICWLRELELLK